MKILKITNVDLFEIHFPAHQGVIKGLPLLANFLLGIWLYALLVEVQKLHLTSAKLERDEALVVRVLSLVFEVRFDGGKLHMEDWEVWLELVDLLRFQTLFKRMDLGALEFLGLVKGFLY